MRIMCQTANKRWRPAGQFPLPTGRPVLITPMLGARLSHGGGAKHLSHNPLGRVGIFE